jgi:AraC-like DNA-binding protein/uncharacterized cupin superfamily protein
LELHRPPFVFHSADEVRVKSDKRHLRPLHVHPECCEVVLIVEGQCRFSINQKVYTVGAGSLVAYNADDWHAEASFKGQSYSCLYLSCSVLDKNEPNRLRAPDASPVQQPAEFERLKAVLMQLIEENSSSYANKQQTVAHLLGLFLSLLSRSLNPSMDAVSDPGQHIRMAKRYIEENAHCALTLELISAEVGLSKSYLSHVFKEHSGISPIQYAIQCRIRLSQYLLLQTDVNIQQIARRTGYKSETHFQQAFKKATGQTPGKYRRSMKEEHSRI